MKEITLDFDGYYRYSYFPNDDLAKSGIYCVYAGLYNQATNRVTLRQLIYIGESGDVSDRLSHHEKLDEWKEYLRAGEELWISVALVDSTDRERAEAACIFEHKPPCNTEYRHNFPYQKTKIITSGKNVKLKAEFTVDCTE